MGRNASTKLTTLYVQNIKKIGMHCDAGCQGLYICVKKNKSSLSKSWVFRYSSPSTGKQRDMGLGSAKFVTLAEARNEAKRYSIDVQNGLDPIDEKRKITKSSTNSKRILFKFASEEVIRLKIPSWTNKKSKQSWENTLEKYVHPFIGEKYVEEIDEDDIVAILQPIYTTIPSTAIKVRGRLACIIDWCIARKLYTKNNPAAPNSPIHHLLPNIRNKTGNFPSLPHQNASAFYKELKSLSTVGAKALEVIFLTGARTREITEAKWEEIDWDTNIWKIPSERTKSRKEHRIPITPLLKDCLQTLYSNRVCETYIFSGRKIGSHISSGTAYQTLKDMPQYKKYTVHGMRASLATWAGEVGLFDTFTIELILSHSLGSKTQKSYQRGDQLAKRSEILKAWEEYLT